jgi:DNA-binding PadR family transcriptional regulator
LLWLLREQPDYGYRLKIRFEERVGPAWPLNIGQVYQSLQSLARGGLVVEVGAECERGARSRRLFEITPKGVRTLEQWLQRRAFRPCAVHDETLIRLFDLEHMSYGDSIAMLERQERVYKRLLLGMNVAPPPPGGTAPGGAALLRAMSMEAGRLHAEAHLRWLSFCRQQLAALCAAAGRATAATG